MGPTRAPPTLWAQFHTLIHVPRSLMENQRVITRPHGGQPIPWNQPTRKLKAPIRVMANPLFSGPIATTGTIMNNMAMDDRIKPKGKKRRALLRSLTLAMTNLEIP